MSRASSVYTLQPESRSFDCGWFQRAADIEARTILVLCLRISSDLTGVALIRPHYLEKVPSHFPPICVGGLLNRNASPIDDSISEAEAERIVLGMGAGGIHGKGRTYEDLGRKVLTGSLFPVALRWTGCRLRILGNRPPTQGFGVHCLVQLLLLSSSGTSREQRPMCKINGR